MSSMSAETSNNFLVGQTLFYYATSAQRISATGTELLSGSPGVESLSGNGEKMRGERSGYRRGCSKKTGRQRSDSACWTFFEKTFILFPRFAYQETTQSQRLFI